MLFLAHKFLTFLETVRVAFYVDDGAVVQDTIQDRSGDGDVGKDFIPLGESLVGSKDGGSFLIASGNQLEKEICPLNIHRKIADLVDNEHSVFGKSFELVRQVVLKMSLFELLNELVAVDVVGGKAVLSRHTTQSGGEMGLADAGRTEEDHIFSIFQ